MKKFILEYKRCSQKCPRQLLRSMQQFVLEEHLDIICTEDDQEVMEHGRDNFSVSCLKSIRPTQAESGVLWSIIPRWKNWIWDFRPLCSMSKTSNSGLVSPKDLTEFITKKSRSDSWVSWSRKYFVKKCICSRSFENLDDVVNLRRLPTYRDILRFQTKWRSLSPKRSLPKKKGLFSECTKF